MISGWERCPGEANGNPLQYSCLGNPRESGLAGYRPWGYKRVGYDLATKQQEQFFLSLFFSKKLFVLILPFLLQTCPQVCLPGCRFRGATRWQNPRGSQGCAALQAVLSSSLARFFLPSFVESCPHMHSLVFSL